MANNRRLVLFKRGIMRQRENLRAFKAEYVSFIKSFFWMLQLNGSLIPETSAHLNPLFEKSSSPRATTSKQTIHIVI